MSLIDIHLDFNLSSFQDIVFGIAFYFALTDYTSKRISNNALFVNKFILVYFYFPLFQKNDVDA